MTWNIEAGATGFEIRTSALKALDIHSAALCFQAMYNFWISSVKFVETNKLISVSNLSAKY